MSTFGVEVGVAYRHPPTLDDYRFYRIEAVTADDATLTACLWALTRGGGSGSPRRRVVQHAVSVLVVDWDQYTNV